jgi:TPR repeat protein
MGEVIRIAGISNYQSAAAQCSVGDAVVLQLDPSNPYDQNAIQVWVGGSIVGYVPRDIAARIARMEAPSDFSARVVERLGGVNGYYVGLRIELAFDIPPMESPSVAPVSLRAEIHDRATQLRSLVEKLLADQHYFPSDPAEAYEVTECLTAVQAALAQEQAAPISRVLDGIRVRFATRRGVHAWRMSLLAAWWEIDAAESQRLAALLVAHVSDAPSCLAMNRFVADVRLSVPEEWRVRIDADAARLRTLAKAAVDGESAFNFGMELLRSDSLVRCVGEAAGLAVTLSGDPSRCVRLLSEVTAASTESDRVKVELAGFSNGFAKRVADALLHLPSDALLMPSEREQLERLAMPSSWGDDSWNGSDQRAQLLMRLAGELGDAEADFIAAMRMQPAEGGNLAPLVQLLLRRALQREDPSTCALVALASLAKRAKGVVQFFATLRLASHAKHAEVDRSHPAYALARAFFAICSRVGRPHVAIPLTIGVSFVGDLDECVRVLEQHARSPCAPRWALLCRDIVMLFHDSDRVDHSAFADRIEMVCAGHPEIGCFFESLLHSADTRFQEWFPDLRERTVRVLRGGVRKGHLPSARDLLSILHAYPDCAEQGEIAKLYELLALHGGRADAAALAWRFASGDGVPKDESKATEWFGKAAAAGDANAQCNYGFRLDRGIGIAADHVSAVNWYRKSAEAGVLVAAYNMGCSYANGEGVTKDEAEAFVWFLRSASGGHANAMHAVVLRLQRGQGTQPDHAQAMIWAARLREQGDARGSLLLGNAHIVGQGVPFDMDKAREMLEEGVQRGSGDAAAALGSLFSEAGFALQDATQAFRWWLAAAKLNHAPAMLKVADCYRDGTGVEKSMVLWFHWSKRALRAGAKQAAPPLARWFISRNTVQGDAMAAAALLKGLRRGDTECGAWLLELIAWGKVRSDTAVGLLLEAARIMVGMAPSNGRLLVGSVLAPMVDLGADLHGLAGIPSRRMNSLVRLMIDVSSVQRRAAELVIGLSRHRDSETLGISTFLREMIAPSEQAMIQRGEVEVAWEIRSAVEPKSVRREWELAHASDFAIAAYGALAREGSVRLPEAQEWLAIASLDDHSGTARYNLAIACTVANAMFCERSAQLVMEAAAAGLKQAQELEVQIRNARSQSGKSFALGVGLVLLGVVIAYTTRDWRSNSRRETDIAHGVCCGMYLLVFGGLFIVLAIGQMMSGGSKTSRRISEVALETHLGSFRIPCPHGHPSLGARWLMVKPTK